MAKTPRRRSQIAGFVAPGVDVLSALNPQISTYNGGSDEFPVGNDRLSKMPFGVDPDYLMEKKRISSKKILILGNIGEGKTSMIKDICMQLMKISSGGRRQRISIDDVNRRNGRPEYELFAKEMRCAPIRLGHPINPFDSQFGFTRSEHLETINSMFSFGNNNLVAVGNQDFVNRVAMSKMYREMGDIASTQTFRTILQYMNEDDVRLYMHENNEKIPAELGIEKMPEKLKDLIARGKTNVIYEEILKDAGHNYQRIDRILEGEFGKVFGGTQSIARKLQQRVVVKDYSGLNITSVALMQQFMWRLRNSAQLRGDRRFMFQVSVHDENYKMMRVEGYPEALTDAMKQGRGNDELIILASHRIRDYWSVGGPESLQRQMATNIFSDIDLLIVGKQNKKDLNDLETLVEITQLERNVIMAQTRGQFAVKIGTEPWFFIETDSTFTEIKERITRSNGALENALNRSIVVEDEFVQLSDEELETEEALV